MSQARGTFVLATATATVVALVVALFLVIFVVNPQTVNNATRVGKIERVVNCEDHAACRAFLRRAIRDLLHQRIIEMRHQRQTRDEAGPSHPFRTRTEGGGAQNPSHSGQQPGPGEGHPEAIFTPEIEPPAPGVLSPAIEEICKLTEPLNLC